MNLLQHQLRSLEAGQSRLSGNTTHSTRMQISKASAVKYPATTVDSGCSAVLSRWSHIWLIIAQSAPLMSSFKWEKGSMLPKKSARPGKMLRTEETRQSKHLLRSCKIQPILPFLRFKSSGSELIQESLTTRCRSTCNFLRWVWHMTIKNTCEELTVLTSTVRSCPKEHFATEISDGAWYQVCLSFKQKMASCLKGLHLRPKGDKWAHKDQQRDIGNVGFCSQTPTCGSLVSSLPQQSISTAHLSQRNGWVGTFVDLRGNCRLASNSQWSSRGSFWHCWLQLCWSWSAD